MSAYSDAQVREIIAERTRLIQWVGDLQSGLYINCVYCGHRYGPGESTPATLPQAGETPAGAALREHVSQCPAHPLSQAKSESMLLRALVERMRDDVLRPLVEGCYPRGPGQGTCYRCRSYKHFPTCYIGKAVVILAEPPGSQP